VINLGSISYPIPTRSSARQEAVKHVRQGGDVVASNCAPYDSDEWAGVYFAAHRTAEGRVWASITLFGQHRHHVFIKTMDESMVPTALGVGPRVLSALTDTTDANSLQWRADAARYRRRRAEAQAAQGTTITLGTPVTLTNGQSVDRVTVQDIALWQSDTGVRIRPRRNWFMDNWSPATP